MESVYAQSTLCRNCGEHFEIGAPAPERSRPKYVVHQEAVGRQDSLRTGLAERVRGWLNPTTGPREVECFQCHAHSQVSGAARSTICPKCGTYIDLQDFRIGGRFSRNITTRGSLYLLPKGEMNSSRAIVGYAEIAGMLHGHLIAQGDVVIRSVGRLRGQIDAKRILVDRKAKVEMLRMIHTRDIEVRGRLVLPRLDASGTVRVMKKGYLEGKIKAMGITVDKGGEFHGSLEIGKVPDPDVRSAAKRGLEPERPDEARAGEAPGGLADAQGEVPV